MHGSGSLTPTLSIPVAGAYFPSKPVVDSSCVSVSGQALCVWVIKAGWMTLHTYLQCLQRNNMLEWQPSSLELDASPQTWPRCDSQIGLPHWGIKPHRCSLGSEWSTWQHHTVLVFLLVSMMMIGLRDSSRGLMVHHWMRVSSGSLPQCEHFDQGRANVWHDLCGV